MRYLDHRAVFFGLLLLSGCASSRLQTSDEAITVSRQHWFGFCAGVCPDYDVTVWADGRVLAVQHSFEAPDKVERFRVSRAEAMRFAGLLNPYRTPGNRTVLAACKHDVPAEEAALVMKVTEIEVRWFGADHEDRLVACDDSTSTALKEAIREALWSVDLYPSGVRRD